MNPFAVVAVVAVGIVAVAEILIARQKAQMKKEFLKELDKQEKEE